MTQGSSEDDEADAEAKPYLDSVRALISGQVTAVQRSDLLLMARVYRGPASTAESIVYARAISDGLAEIDSCGQRGSPSAWRWVLDGWLENDLSMRLRRKLEATMTMGDLAQLDASSRAAASVADRSEVLVGDMSGRVASGGGRSGGRLESYAAGDVADMIAGLRALRVAQPILGEDAEGTEALRALGGRAGAAEAVGEAVGEASGVAGSQGRLPLGDLAKSLVRLASLVEWRAGKAEVREATEAAVGLLAETIAHGAVVSGEAARLIARAICAELTGSLPREVDLEGRCDSSDPGIRYIGKASLSNGEYHVLADVHGALCMVAVRITFEDDGK